MCAKFGLVVGGAARGAAAGSVDGPLIKGGAGVLVDCLAGCAPFKGKRLGGGRLTGLGSTPLVVWSSAFKPADQPSRPPPTGSLESRGVCTTPVRLTPVTPIRLIRKLTKPQGVGGLGGGAWWETSLGTAAAGAATATGSSVTTGIGTSAAGASMSDQRLSAISASRSSALLAKLMNLARFRGRLSYLEGEGPRW